MSVEVSIIIPIYNEENYIAKCLQSILQQDFPKAKLEILLVDGRSTDGTRKIIKGYARQYPFVRILYNSARCVPKAMNFGLAKARGQYILRMDAHTIYPPDYVSKCVATLNEIEADNVGGNIVTLPGGTGLKAQAIATATSHIFGVGNSKFRTSRQAGYVDTVPFGAFRRSVFEKVGLFNEDLVRNQDIELNSRIIKSGGKVYLNPEIKAYYYNKATLSQLWIQNFKNGEWNIYTAFSNKKALSLRHFVPLTFVSATLGFTLLSIFSPIFALLLSLLLGVYGAVCSFFSVAIGLTKGKRLIPILPAVFAVLHVSYGTGSLWGILQAYSWMKNHPGALKNYKLTHAPA